MDSPLKHLMEECRQKQETYEIKKNEQPVQLSLFKLKINPEE